MGSVDLRGEKTAPIYAALGVSNQGKHNLVTYDQDPDTSEEIITAYGNGIIVAAKFLRSGHEVVSKDMRRGIQITEIVHSGQFTKERQGVDRITGALSPNRSKATLMDGGDKATAVVERVMRTRAAALSLIQ